MPLGSDPELSLILQNSGVGDEISYPLYDSQRIGCLKSAGRRSFDSSRALMVATESPEAEGQAR